MKHGKRKASACRARRARVSDVRARLCRTPALGSRARLWALESEGRGRAHACQCHATQVVPSMCFGCRPPGLPLLGSSVCSLCRPVVPSCPNASNAYLLRNKPLLPAAPGSNPCVKQQHTYMAKKPPIQAYLILSSNVTLLIYSYRCCTVCNNH